MRNWADRRPRNGASKGKKGDEMRLLLAMIGMSSAIGFAAPAHADPSEPNAGDDAGFLAALHTA